MPESAAVRAGRVEGRAIGSSLVTGGGGFAARHLVDLLSHSGGSPAAPPRAELNLLDPAALRQAASELEPEVIFHLAALSSPRLSWDDPAGAVLDNLRMTTNVLDAVRHEAPAARLVLVGSGQVYGSHPPLPVTEDAPFAPGNPYAVSKAAGEMLARQYETGFGLSIVRLRPFNHAGPGQSDEYVLATMARQVAEAEARGDDEALLRTGDVSVGRDFTDVRDVVRGYVLAADAAPGVYNVCSGRATRVEELIEMLGAAANIAVRQEVDPARLRPHDPPELRGSAERLAAATGWRPQIPLAQTVRDTVDWWRDRLSSRA